MIAQSDDALLARGRYLMNGVVACGNCHIARGPQGQPLFEQGLSGGMRFDEAPFTAIAPNITPDQETGIGNWTNAQIARAIREGVRPDGSLIGPPMPVGFYRHISDDDLAALIAYLKSQPPVHHVVEKSVYRMPLPANYGPPVGKVGAPPQSDRVAYGKYLAQIGHCMECHTPRDSKGVLVESRTGAGGQLFKGPWGVSVSSNLTSSEKGLGGWSDAQIIAAIREGVQPTGRHLMPPMAFGWYKNINDADMAALVAYLRSLPPRQ